MGNLDFSANASQLEQLAAYMASQINVPTIGIGGGYAPIGSINFFDATTAPQDWLACDGTVYNIADYPQLADWYEAQHGSKNFYGGDGTTTFAVPDLQGEFLRGTGTNSHTNQGSGAALGVHQDGTEHLDVKWTSPIFLNGSDFNAVLNKDSSKDDGHTRKNIAVRNTETSTSSGTYYMSRPTNTSFLICVKAVVAGEVYSTDERVVGTWIDGKQLYQKAFTGTKVQNTDLIFSASTLAIDKVIKIWGILYGNGGNDYPIPTYQDSKIFIFSYYRPQNNNIYVSGISNYSGIDYYSGDVVLNVQYTKTTD